jgi:ankyrin repeat protein
MMVGRCAIAVGLVAAGLTAVSAADRPLADAARNADWGVVRALVEQGADVTARQGDGATALHWAAYWNHTDIAGLLIDAGADVDAANDLGVTPLWAAAENRSAAMVERLLDAGANPDAPLLSGETPLMTAARVGAADVARQLLAAGADTAVTAGRGQTALMWAVAQRHPDVVEALLAHGAAVDARSDVWTEVVKTTPEPWNPEYVTEIPQGGYTPLLFAARVGDLASATLLVAAGADVNDQPPYGTSATVVAAHSGHREVAVFLLRQGADPNAADAGYTALHSAILHKDAALVRALLDHGADVDAPVESSTPVRRDAVDFYLHPSYVGATPFWLAARFNAPDIMRLLLERGADPLAVHHPKYWPGSLSIRDERVQVEEGATTALMAAAGLGGRDPLFSVDRLSRIAESAPVRSTRREPDAALRERTMLDAITVAAGQGIDVNVANAEGNTALHAAAGRGYDSVVEYLVGQGARLDVKNEDGRTPLALAQRGLVRGRSSTPHDSTVELLRRLGAGE